MSKKKESAGKAASLDTDTIVLHPYTEDAYLRYSMAVVRDRAIAQIQDGQKPVQKRILYDMRDLGLSSDAKAVKSARVVGDVLGKLHPHGDSSVYDALVRMAQGFTLRYPLIHGEGNFGSRDGDPAAAYRYTECKLAAFSDILLSELDRGTVDFVNNFDNTRTEPAILPARLPVLLLNGSMGIAVGMASGIPPHNLIEVGRAVRQLIDKPKTSDAEMLAHILGPDFPEGGQLITPREEMLAAYATGRGTLHLRARYEVEELARGQWQLVITELPYQIKASSVLEEIEALCNPQASANAKSITQKQSNVKQAALMLLEKATDESGKDALVRLVITPRSSKQSVDELVSFLFANTELETTISINLTFIGLDGSPQTRGVAEMLRQWSQFRLKTVERRIAFDLEKLRRRIHLLEGRMLVFLNVDKVIKCIRESDDPKADLMAKFKLTDPQAEDILEMRLRALARLEGIRIEKELTDARVQEAHLVSQIATDKSLRKQVVSELDADIAKYGTPRRTIIKEEPRAKGQAAAAVTKSLVDDPITVLVSKNLWIRARPGHDLDPATVGWKAGDAEFAIIKTRTTHPVLFLDSTGRAYSIDGAAIPTSRGDGVPLSTLIELQDGAKLSHVFSDDSESEYVFCGSEGYGFRAPLKALVARPRAGKAFLTLQEGELPLRPVASNPKGFVACGSSDGRLLIFPMEELKQLDKGKGVKIMVLAEGEKMVALLVGEGEPWELPLEGKATKFIVKGEDWAKYCMHRARRGCQLPKKSVLAG